MTIAWRKHLLRVALVLAVAVHLPALSSPLLFDDYAQAAMAEGRFVGARSPLDFYDYIDAANRDDLLASGNLPWWSDRQLTVRFLRPLASALRWADYRVFGHRVVWHHVHSLLWWGLAVAGVHALLRRSFERRAAFLGTAVFSVAVCHATPLAWLADRVALVSPALGTFALLSYLRWRDERRPRDALASLALFSLAFLAGEYATCLGGYVVATELARRREPLGRRALGVLPFALPAAAYLWVHLALRYGAHGAGFYRDPLSDVFAYAQGVPRRLAVLLGVAWLGVEDAWFYAPAWKLALLAVACGVVAIPVVRVVRGLGEDSRAPAAIMLVGSLLSLAPVLAVDSAARVLGIPMIGVSAVVGLVLDRAWFPPSPVPRRGFAELTGLVALALGFVHLVRAPLDTVLVSRGLAVAGQRYKGRIAWVREHVGAAVSTVYVLRADSPESLLWGGLALDEDPPPRLRVLSFASGRSLLLRTGPRSLELAAGSRPLVPVGPDDLFRRAGELKVGDVVRVPGMNVTILKTDEEDCPSRLRFDLDEDFDSPSVRWITDGETGYRVERPPEVGFGAPLMP